MVKYDLKIESANITAQKNYYNSFYDYYFDFQFAIDGWVSSDKALEIGTKAVSVVRTLYYLDSYQVEYIEIDKYKLEYNEVI